MGGASFASAELTDESERDRPAVQVGDPFLEKSLVEACLEAFKTGAIVAAQDMGAAGITCSTAEMAAKGGVGIELDLDLIPVRETGMVPYEYLLSESQERMLFVVATGREAEVIAIFERWGLHAVVAGTVIDDPIVRILFKGAVAAEIPALPRFDITGARYFWNYNGDRKGKWADVRITCADGKVTVQTPYAGYIFNLEGAQYKAIDDVHEYRFVNGAATLDLEFMQEGGAIDYIRLIVGEVGSNTHMEWFPQIFDFIQIVKS
jgi:hypothetical protein